MATKRKYRKNGRIGPDRIGNPRGVIQTRVEKVTPQRFGVVAIDCAKVRSKYMLLDFFGRVILPAAEVEHGQAQMKLAIVQVKEACREQGIRDVIVAVEMTGTYHRPIQRAFRRAGFETRLVHPFASKHYRAPAHADTKTDDKDLEGIFRAAVNGFGLLEPIWDEVYLQLQLLARHRRDLVEKRAKLQCQIRHHLHRCLPGYADLFSSDNLWRRPTGMTIARHATTPHAIRQAGVDGVSRWLRKEKIHFQSRTVEKIVAWSANAADADPMAEYLSRIWQTLHDDWQSKSLQLDRVECEMAEILVKTPYLLLLSLPGINVISAADLAGEMGPIEHYAHARAITGRAGLFPSRYQSDTVDRADGPLAKHRNTRLRAALLRVAENLIKCNSYYRGQAQLWKQRHVNARDTHCRIANRVTRPVFQIVSGRKLYRHHGQLDRGYVMDKLLAFLRDHHVPPHAIVGVMRQAVAQIPEPNRAEEAAPLRKIYERSRRSRQKGPQEIGDVLVEVLARLGVDRLESQPEAQGPRSCRLDGAHDNVVEVVGSATPRITRSVARGSQDPRRSVPSPY
jgi:transposase